MLGSPLVLADQARAEQFGLLGSVPRLFNGFTTWLDADGVPWAGRRCKDHGFGFTWLGPGWVFDSYARKLRADKLAARRQAVARADDSTHRHELAEVLGRIRLGGHAERLLWAVHGRVLEARTSLLKVPDTWLGTVVWR